MIVGVPKEIKVHEYRVGLTPQSVRELVARGHEVRIETNAGAAIDFDDDAYRAAGATIVATAEEVFAAAALIVKVKEPQEAERRRLREGQVLFTYLHLAPDPAQAKDLMASRAICIAYETVTSGTGSLPLLAPMSEVAGRMSIQAGASALEKSHGGRGVLLSGVPGVAPAKVVILGGGVVGRNAATIAIGMGAQVTVLDVKAETMAYLEDVFGGALETLYSNPHNIEEAVTRADLVVGAVLVTGAVAPKLVTADLVSRMEKGSVIVDVAVDQGGCIETCRPTNHDQPTYEVSGVVHYCVPNMPGAVSQTSTWALTNTTMSFAVKIAESGVVAACKADRALALGMNCYGGHVTYEPVAQAHKMEYVPTTKLLG